MIVVYELNGKKMNEEFADLAALQAWIAKQGSVETIGFTKGE
tara:strand:- start:16 stop:141 length:126 start_codon:yes stop_codon:yes gene_type:complete